MNEETTEKKLPENEILKAIADLSKQIADFKNEFGDFRKETEVQFEAIRTGIAASNIAFERLAGKVYLMSANLTELQEELRKKELV